MSKLFSYIIIPMLLFGFMIHSPNVLAGDKPEEPHAEEHAEASEDDAHGDGDHHAEHAYVTLPDFLINLREYDGKSGMMKLSLVLSIEPSAVKQIEGEFKPKIIDRYNHYLRNLTMNDVHGSVGMYRMRQELIARANQITDPHQVKDVLFQRILLQ